uniref:Uncharacterized protein n=1 Tax=Tanacetum cinerariifolium TaxID=118510 RepID=A0A6L2KRQ2_TANCI|nr:hypothetical protein [Tanacetum cinerariifolium]
MVPPLSPDYDVDVTTRSRLTLIKTIRNKIKNNVRGKLFRKTCFASWLDVNDPRENVLLVHYFIYYQLKCREGDIAKISQKLEIFAFEHLIDLRMVLIPNADSLEETFADVIYEDTKRNHQEASLMASPNEDDKTGVNLLKLFDGEKGSHGEKTSGQGPHMLSNSVDFPSYLGSFGNEFELPKWNFEFGSSFGVVLLEDHRLSYTGRWDVNMTEMEHGD